ncbi:hypothetical protein P43SY_004912 [Pythium insidiosum]|uniref:WW domain-containing protein n=1 Tax=Pythium insidiosum TaxID=114742 RepID=A0AAD5QCW1_PYTIN|nr:hypothetical protein P43SY_004912 [Pythium insidiosum]
MDAELHGVPYPEWPESLGPPRLHRLDDPNEAGGPRSRAEIVRRFRQRRPELHDTAVSSVAKAKPHVTRIQNALQQTTPFPTPKCTSRVTCRGAVATKKCHNCVKFDPEQLGYYCEPCFGARHPSSRMPHSWVAVGDEVSAEHNWLGHVATHKMQQDAAELELLLQETQRFLQTNSQPPKRDPAVARTPRGSIDFTRARGSVAKVASSLRELLTQLHEELARKPLTREEALVKIQTMWRIRKARKQMKELIHSVYERLEDPATGMTYYYNRRSKTTQWTKPRALGANEDVGSKNQRDSASAHTPTPKARQRPSLLAVEDDAERRECAARRIQGMQRTHVARRQLRKLISSVYEKIWDDSVQRFYYHNTRTKEVKWERPRWVSDADLLTPRTREAHARAQRRQSLRMSEDEAASLVQRAYRRRRGFAMLLEMCRGVYERIFDAERQLYYYHNTRTKEVSWDKPLLLRDASADVFTPRTRQRHAQALWTQPQLRRKGEWTEETAAVRLQGLFRARQARKALDAKLVDAYKKVWDPTTQQFYFANLATGATSWEPPAILRRRAGLQVEELRDDTPS